MRFWESSLGSVLGELTKSPNSKHQPLSHPTGLGMCQLLVCFGFWSVFRSLWVWGFVLSWEVP